MLRQINIFAKIARIVNLGNSIAVDENGVEDNVDPSVQAACYLGTEDRTNKRCYQKRITAPWLVDPLLKVAHGMRMQLYILGSATGCYLVCVLSKGKYSGIGYHRLDENGLSHDQEKAMEAIARAADEAFSCHILAVGIIEDDKKVPMSVGGLPDSLLVAA
jgi:hypothetical protein